MENGPVEMTCVFSLGKHGDVHSYGVLPEVKYGPHRRMEERNRIQNTGRMDLVDLVFGDNDNDCLFES